MFRVRVVPGMGKVVKKMGMVSRHSLATPGIFYTPPPPAKHILKPFNSFNPACIASFRLCWSVACTSGNSEIACSPTRVGLVFMSATAASGVVMQVPGFCRRVLLGSFQQDVD